MASSATITLYRGFQGTGHYTWSPFVTKLETRLRFGGTSYRVDVGSPMKAPRGKIPYIKISTPEKPDQMLGDSTMIIGKLIDEGLLKDLNANLSPVEKAHDLALRALLEDKLYFYQTYERWQQNYYTMRSGILAALPYPVQLVVGLLAYRSNKQTLYGQGTGRFTPEEIAALRQEVWESINDLLVAAKQAKPETKAAGDVLFWLSGGEEPSEADSVLYGFIASALVCPAAPDTAALVRSFPKVMDYARRIHDHYFPDYASWN